MERSPVWLWKSFVKILYIIGWFFTTSLNFLRLIIYFFMEALCCWMNSVAGVEIQCLLTLLCLCSLQSSGIEEMVWEQYTVTLQRVSSFTNCAVKSRDIYLAIDQPEVSRGNKWSIPNIWQFNCEKLIIRNSVLDHIVLKSLFFFLCRYNCIRFIQFSYQCVCQSTVYESLLLSPSCTCLITGYGGGGRP